MAQPWSRVLNTTIRDYVREREVNILRNRKILAFLKKRGRITYNHSGISVDWKVQYKRVRPTPFADGDTLDFAQKDRYKTANVDWRGYSITDSINKGEFLKNRGKEAIIKVFSEMASNLMDDIEDYFNEELFVDGTTAANSKRLYGIESFLQASANAGNGVASPTGSYGGISCVPGNYGGVWVAPSQFSGSANSGWPHGRGDAQFDFWSPIIVDYGDSLFPGGSSPGNTWEANCIEAISMLLVKTQKNKSTRGTLDLIEVDDEMWRVYKKRMRAMQRINVERGSESSELVALGFRDVLNQDGVDVTTEYGLPPGVGYGFNIDMMELMSMQAQLFVPEGPQQDMATKSWRVAVDMFGQNKWNPKFFGALKKLT